MTTLRQRIQLVGIQTTVKKVDKHKYESLPASSKKLFKKAGIPWNVFERTLRDEGWLAESECLWEVLKVPANLRRGISSSSFVAVDLDVEDWDENRLDDLWEDINHLRVETK